MSLQKYAINGDCGFIGSALVKELDKIMTRVDFNDHPDYVFHFGSPSSQRQFDEDYHCVTETVEGFMEIAEYCRRHRAKLIFPSSSTVYDNKLPYARTKSALEDLVEAYKVDYLALRIFAGYGPDERHKRDYASPIYQFCRDIVNNRQPIVYGDGTQTRDFVYIDDIVKTIIKNVDKSGIIDIGTGNPHSFNEVISMINQANHTDIKPIYVGKPQGYINETKCLNPLREYTPIYQGIKKIIKSL